MAFNEYIQSGGKYLRCGYTTGTCAALAASAAARLLLTGSAPESVSLLTPKGVRVEVVPDVCEYVDENENIYNDSGKFSADAAHKDTCKNSGKFSADDAHKDACKNLGKFSLSDARKNAHKYQGTSAIAAVRKDAGDDKDATDGILIYATVTVESEQICGFDAHERTADTPAAHDEQPTLMDEPAAHDEHLPSENGPVIHIDGGRGIGRVTKPGLDQPVGNAAINHVPREMIEKAVRDVCELAGFQGELRVVISAPEGEKVAKKTFNEHLGIEGGISILGTSGIVEPMSMQAFIDAVCVEIRQVRRMSESGRLILTPGNYGMDFLREYLGKRGSNIQTTTGPNFIENGPDITTKPNNSTTFDYNLVENESDNTAISDIPIVACSNFIGDALDAAAAEGFREVLLVGHIGKLVKLAGGVMNTHSRYADCRMELFAAHAAICGADRKTCRRLMECVTTDACVEILREGGICQDVMDALLSSMEKYLLRRVGGAYRVGAMTFSNVHGPLGATPQAEEILRSWRFCE